MAVTQQDYFDAIGRAGLVWSDGVLANINLEKAGCQPCWNDLFCQFKKIEGAEYFFRLGDYAVSEDSALFYSYMLAIAGTQYATMAQPIVLPTVNAGSNATITLPTSSRQFTGTVTPGTYAIASTVWTQISGPTTATLTNATTLVMTASSVIQGAYTFRLTATDSEGNTAFDDVNLTVNAALPVAYYGAKLTGTALTEGQIEAGSSTTFTSGGNVTIPYDNVVVNYMWFAIPNAQPVKNYYEDLAQPLNQGPIGTAEDFFGAPVTVGAYDFYITNYLTSYPDYTPDKGIVFKTL